MPFTVTLCVSIQNIKRLPVLLIRAENIKCECKEYVIHYEGVTRVGPLDCRGHTHNVVAFSFISYAVKCLLDLKYINEKALVLIPELLVVMAVRPQRGVTLIAQQWGTLR